MDSILKEKRIIHSKSRHIVTYIILFGLILILIAGVLMLNEILKARKFCSSVRGNYSMKLPNHYCNGVKIFPYSSGWDFERNYSLGRLNLNG